MTSILTFSGWGQKPDSLCFLVPGSAACDYKKAHDYDALVQQVKAVNYDVQDIVIGWSLGAQLACRLVNDGILKANALILIAPPYQYVSTKQLACGISPFMFKMFRNNFLKKPEHTLRKFALLSDMNRHMMQQVEAMLDLDSENNSHWLRWLDHLGEFSCESVDLNNMPPTTIIHADDDKVTSHTQTDYFKKRLENVQVHIVEGGGHIPHLHHQDKVKMLISELRSA